MVESSTGVRQRVWARVRLVLLMVLILPILVELICFAAISLSNQVIYGSAYEGSRARYDAHTVFLQTDGRRATAFNVRTDAPARNRTIWMFGGSTMRGSTPDDARTIPSIVARILNEGADTGQCFTVVNFGVNSFNSLLEVKYLQKCLIEETSTPDLVVFYDGANDATYFVQYRSSYAHHGCEQLDAIVGSYRNRRLGLGKSLTAAMTASFTREVWRKLRAVTAPLPPDLPELQRFVELTGRRYDHAQRLAEAYGGRLMVVWQPMRWTEDGTGAVALGEGQAASLMSAQRFQTFGQNVRVVYGALREQVTQRSDAVDFSNILSGQTGLVYRADGVHLTDAGREMVGQAIAARIRQAL